MSAPIRSQGLFRQLFSRCSSQTAGQPLRSSSHILSPTQSHNNILPQTRHFTCTSPSTAPATSDSTPTSTPASPIPNAPDTTTYYTIFPQTLPMGPPPSSPFAIDPSLLRREFLQIQNKIHPDKYPPGPTKQVAEALSARINEAYRTLLDPLSRGQYLLREFHGIDVTAEDGASQHPLDPELLMEVMDVQETIEEVSGVVDAEERIAELKRENEERVLECVRLLGERFNEGDVEGAKTECIRLKFWSGVAGALREWEPGMTQIRLVH